MLSNNEWAFGDWQEVIDWLWDVNPDCFEEVNASWLDVENELRDEAAADGEISQAMVEEITKGLESEVWTGDVGEQGIPVVPPQPEPMEYRDVLLGDALVVVKAIERECLEVGQTFKVEDMCMGTVFARKPDGFCIMVRSHELANVVRL